MIPAIIFSTFIAVCTIIAALWLSEFRRAPDETIPATIHPILPAIGVVLIITIPAFGYFFSIGVAIVFILGMIASSIIEYFAKKIHAENSKHSLFPLCALACSILVYSLLWTIAGTGTALVALATGALTISFLTRATNELQPFLVTTVGVLGAHFFYAGSERAVGFTLALLAVGCASTLISIFVATHYAWKTPQQMFHGACIAFFLFGLTTTSWLLEFKPLMMVACVGVGLVCAIACTRIHKPWIPLACIFVGLSAGYSLAEFYGIIIVLLAFYALIGNIRLLKFTEHRVSIDIFLLLTIFILFVHSITVAGRSILFELNDPYILAGILMSGALMYVSASQREKPLMLIAPVVLTCISIALFQKTHGVVVLCGMLFGLVVRDIFERTITPLIQTYLFIGMLLVAVVFRP